MRVEECNLLHSLYCGVILNHDVVIGIQDVEPQLKTSVHCSFSWDEMNIV